MMSGVFTTKDGRVHICIDDAFEPDRARKWGQAIIAHADAIDKTATLDRAESICIGNIRKDQQATFKRGDRVEHVENHGFVMTVSADQYTSGAVLVEWPDGTRHDYQAKYLKRAEPAATIQTLSIDPGGDWGMAEDVVSAPSHYRAHPSGIETIAITKHESFLRGNVLKYVLRAPYKNNELEDLKKASQYLAWEIERLEQS